MTSRSFVSFFFGALAPLACVYALDASVDVSALGQRPLIENLAAHQSEHELLVWPAAFDQRAWVARRLQTSCPDVWITGSSTMGQIAQTMVPKRRLLNGWM